MRPLLLAVVLVAGCGDDGGYRVLISLDPPAIAEELASARVSVVPQCPPEDLMAENPPEARRSVEIRPGNPTAALGGVAEGTWGIHAIVRDAACGVLAAGCSTVELEAGGSGTLTVVARSVAGGGCEAVEECADGACVARDPGDPSCSTTPSDCRMEGEACGQARDCCTCSCEAGRCEGLSGCAVASEGCDVDEDCCTGACGSDTSTGETVYRCRALGGCRPAGELCGGPTDCCSGQCESGRCSELDGCTVSGELCDVDEDCCTGACGSDTSTGETVYRCAPLDGCRPEGELCSGPESCCSAECRATGRCRPTDGCNVLGELCDVDEECCSGSCASDTSSGETVYRCS